MTARTATILRGIGFNGGPGALTTRQHDRGRDMKRVWVLRVVAVAIAGGGAVVANTVLDPSRTTAVTVLLLSSLGVGILLGLLSTKIKA
jgi:hypothetical protein